MYLFTSICLYHLKIYINEKESNSFLYPVIPEKFLPGLAVTYHKATESASAKFRNIGANKQ